MSDNEPLFSYITDNTNRAMLDLVMTFIDSEVIGKMEIAQEGGMITSISVSREYAQEVGYAEDPEEPDFLPIPNSFSAKYVGDALQGNIRTLNLNRRNVRAADLYLDQAAEEE